MITLDTEGIAKMLGCTRRHAMEEITKAAWFPAPVINLSRRMRRWDEDEVIAACAARSRARFNPASTRSERA